MNEKITVNKQMLIDIHNTIIQLHPTGDEILAVAAVIVDLRRVLQEEQPKPEQKKPEQPKPEAPKPEQKAKEE